jgi:hypothetical protein
MPLEELERVGSSSGITIPKSLALILTLILLILSLLFIGGFIFLLETKESSILLGLKIVC